MMWFLMAFAALALLPVRSAAYHSTVHHLVSSKPLARGTSHVASLGAPVRCWQGAQGRRKGAAAKHGAVRCQEEAGEDARTEISANAALDIWQRAREIHAHSLKFGVGTSRRYVSVLVVSNECIRALLVEKTLQKLLPSFFADAEGDDAAEMGSQARAGALGGDAMPEFIPAKGGDTYEGKKDGYTFTEGEQGLGYYFDKGSFRACNFSQSFTSSSETTMRDKWGVSSAAPRKSDRLLFLSAGLTNEPGASVPPALVRAAAEHGVDLTDDNPRAAFDPSDLEYYDFILCVDREVRDKVLTLAALRAGTYSISASLSLSVSAYVLCGLHACHCM